MTSILLEGKICLDLWVALQVWLNNYIKDSQLKR